MPKENFQRCIAVGAGPSNLSLAALAAKIPSLELRVFERNDSIRWHSGMQISDTELQVSYLKDLVTLVDPTNPYSFLNFLKSEKRLYRSLVANRDYTSRKEFERYLKWVSQGLGNVKNDVAVQNITFRDGEFCLETSQGKYQCDDLVFGVGRTPTFPPFVEPCHKIVHSSDYTNDFQNKQMRGKTITVVGGGQSGCEIVSDLIEQYQGDVHIIWICKRLNLMGLEDTPFVNEQYSPNFVNYFMSLDQSARNHLNVNMRCTSDGISERTLSKIYRQLYDLECVEQKKNAVDIRLATNVETLDGDVNSFSMTLRDQLTGDVTNIQSDNVIFATGYKFQLPACLASLCDDPNLISEKWELCWGGPKSNKIFVQNSLVEKFGLPEPNLSLLAWRSATILNALCDREVYELDEAQGALRWEQQRPHSAKELING